MLFKSVTLPALLKFLTDSPRLKELIERLSPADLKRLLEHPPHLQLLWIMRAAELRVMSDAELAAIGVSPRTAENLSEKVQEAAHLRTGWRFYQLGVLAGLDLKGLTREQFDLEQLLKLPAEPVSQGPQEQAAAQQQSAPARVSPFAPYENCYWLYGAGWMPAEDRKFFVTEVKAMDCVRCEGGNSTLMLHEFGALCLIERDKKWFAVYRVRESNDPNPQAKQAAVVNPIACSLSFPEVAQSALQWAERHGIAPRLPDDPFDAHSPSPTQLAKLAEYGSTAKNRFEAGMKLTAVEISRYVTYTKRQVDRVLAIPTSA